MIDPVDENDWTSERIASGYYLQSFALPEFNKAAPYIEFGDVYTLKLKAGKNGIYRCQNGEGQMAQRFKMPEFSSPFEATETARVVLDREMKRCAKEATASPYLIAPSHGLKRRQQLGLPTVPLCTTKRLLSTRKHFPGIHSTYGYISSGPSFTPAHRDDFWLQSVSALYRGRPKIWVIIAPRHSNQLEANLIKKDYRCSQSVRHLDLMPAPRTLENWGIDFKVVMQHPGEVMRVDHGVYHYVLNMGPNIAEAVNFCGPKWFPPPAYVPCQSSMGCPGETHITREDMQIVRPRHLDATEDEKVESADSQDEMMGDEGNTEDAKEDQDETEASDGGVSEISEAGEASGSEEKAMPHERAVDNEHSEDNSEANLSFFPSLSPSFSSRSFPSASLPEEEEKEVENEEDEEREREEEWQGNEARDSRSPPDDVLFEDGTGETLHSTKDGLDGSSYATIDIDRSPAAEDFPYKDDLPYSSTDSKKHLPLLSRLPSQSSHHGANECLNSGISESLSTILSPPKYTDHKGQKATEVIDLDKIEQTSQNIKDFDSGLGEELSITSSPGKPRSYPSMQRDTAEALVQEVLPYLYLFEWPSGDSSEGTAEALTTLCRENWLNDRVISEVLVKLTSDAARVRFIEPCHLRRRFEQSDPSVLPPLEDCRLLLAPFWVGSHWFLISADFARSRMICHDAYSRRKEIEYMQKVIRLQIDHEIVWQLVESDKTIPMDGNNCGVYLLAQAQNTIDPSFCPTQNPMELRLHFTNMLLGPTLRRLEMQTKKRPNDTKHQPTTSRKRPRLYFDEHDGPKKKADIIEMVNAVGSPAVFADLAVVIQTATTESCSAMRPVEMAMESFTTAGANMVASKITRICASIIVYERYTELVTRHRHRLQTNKKLRKARKRQGEEVSKEDTPGRDARHFALRDVISEWQGISSTEVEDQENFSRQRRAVDKAKNIGQHCLGLQKQWDDQPLWSLIPHRPILTTTGSSLIDAESYKSLSPEEAKLFITELKLRRPLFWKCIHKLSAQLLRCLQLGSDAPRVKLHALDLETIRNQEADSEILLHCLDDIEGGTD